MDKQAKDKLRRSIINGRIYKTKRYKAWRAKVFKRDRYKCQKCGKVGGFIQAHHIKMKYKFPELAFSLINGITLCYNCHQQLHKKNEEEKYAKDFKKKAKENKPKPRMLRRA